MRWRELLFKNLWWKLLSFALAVMIWSGAQRLEVHPSTTDPFSLSNDRVIFHVPLRVLSLPAEARPVRLDPDHVRVEVEGRRSQLEQLRPEDFVAFVEPGTAGRPADVEVKVPIGARLVEVLPPRALVSAIAP